MTRDSSYSIRQAIPKCYEFGDVRKEIIIETKSSNHHSRMYQQQIMSWGVSFLSCYIFLIAVVRQQFVIGINCSIFLYWSSFGDNQPLALTGSPSELCSRRMFGSNRFNTMHAVCTDFLCVVCIELLSAEFSTVNTGLGRHS